MVKDKVGRSPGVLDWASLWNVILFPSLLWHCWLGWCLHVVSVTHKYDHDLSRLFHTELHWLDVTERVTFKLGVMTYGCLYRQAPQYLLDVSLLVSHVSSRQHLQSATRVLLVVLRCLLSTFGQRAFLVAGRSVWNSLPDSLRDPALTRDEFGCLLKMELFTLCWSI